MSCGTVLVQWRPRFVQVLETPASSSTELNRNGMNILVVKGTVHTRLKEIHTKATVIALASFDVGRLKKSLKEDEEEEQR